ncbi:MAG: aminoacetone oxidase family FAD-binding enzyme [Elusimicrobiota bacterium]|jgi:hypothetical protein
MTKIVVIGGGASGLAAAVSAARHDAEVTVLERGHNLGRKILASGGGRCNLGHAHIQPEHYHGGRPAFLRDALAGFKTAETLRFFTSLGLLTVQEPDGRIFPRSGKSQTVLDVFKTELDRLSVRQYLGTEAVEVRRAGGGFVVQTAAAGLPWRKSQGGEAPRPPAQALAADKVILACGGAAHPQLGAGEAAYALAKALGHTVTGLSPALVPLCLKSGALTRLHGLRANAAMRIYCAGRESAHSAGEVLFTEYGLSGPAVLDISREAARGLASGPVQGKLNLFPELAASDLKSLLEKRWAIMARRPLKDFFIGMFPHQLAGAVMDELGVDARRTPDSLGREGRERLAALLSGWDFTVNAARPWSEAMVTAGGISLDEVDPGDLQSRKTQGIYLTGEMLDVDGDSGGYNLHFAWASGVMAGLHAAGQRPA